MREKILVLEIFKPSNITFLRLAKVGQQEERGKRHRFGHLIDPEGGSQVLTGDVEHNGVNAAEWNVLRGSSLNWANGLVVFLSLSISITTCVLEGEFLARLSKTRSG